jgi:hypothetical protein
VVSESDGFAEQQDGAVTGGVPSRSANGLACEAAAAFLALRFAGAACLIYLGARLLLAPKDKPAASRARRR